jgi:hypothetical protein
MAGVRRNRLLSINPSASVGQTSEPDLGGKTMIMTRAAKTRTTSHRAVLGDIGNKTRVVAGKPGGWSNFNANTLYNVFLHSRKASEV